MRDRGYVGDAGDLVAASIQSANGGLAARARALDVDVQVLQTVFQGSLAGTLGRYLGSERGALREPRKPEPPEVAQDSALP